MDNSFFVCPDCKCKVKKKRVNIGGEESKTLECGCEDFKCFLPKKSMLGDESDTNGIFFRCSSCMDPVYSISQKDNPDQYPCYKCSCEDPPEKRNFGT